MTDTNTEDQSLSDNPIEPEGEDALKGVAGGVTVEMPCPQCGVKVHAHQFHDSWRFKCPACGYKSR